MRTLPVQEFRRLDLNSEEMGVPVAQLMQNAGAALAQEAGALAPDGLVVILCGKGNNGGDGYAAASQLRAAGREVRCIALEPPVGPESQAAQAAVPAQDTVSWAAFTRESPALIVDCMLGSGMRGGPRPPYDAAIAWCNDARAAGTPVLSCDIPSGLGSTTAVLPDATVTFHAAKEGMQAGNSGRIIVADIGIPAAAETDIGMGDLIVGYPRATSASHKGDNGRVAVIAGGPFTGAPYYASVGAYRTGADMVQLYLPAEAAAAVRCYGPEPIVHDAGPGRHLTEASVPTILDALEGAPTLLIGPGLGSHPETVAAAERILQQAMAKKLPTVIDADGLDAVPDGYWAQNGERTVITPHAKEFQDLTGQPANEDNAANWARETGCVVVLKGATDIVAAPHRIKWCRRGHPTMTVGGTGDVLAGCIAAIMSRGATAFDAAAAGTYLLGVAGERAAAELGAGAVALDIADHIPGVLAQMEPANS